MKEKEHLNEIMQSSLNWQNMLDSSVWQNRAVLSLFKAVYWLAEILFKMIANKEVS